VGAGFVIESYSHIGLAGKILLGKSKYSLGPTDTGGLGLTYRF
jgi:hypothetical protein